MEVSLQATHYYDAALFTYSI